MRSKPIIEKPSIAQVLTAIAAVPTGGYIATDADNTLWAGDVGDEVVRFAGSADCAPWPSGVVDFAWYNRQMEEHYFEGCCFSAKILADVDPIAAAVGVRRSIGRHVRARSWLTQALEASRLRGVNVWIVSASPRLAVEVGADLFGVANWPIIAVDCIDGGKPAYIEPIPIGEGKVAAWQQLGLPPPDLALGDSQWDLPLLRSARVGFLLERADREMAP